MDKVKEFINNKKNIIICSIVIIIIIFIIIFIINLPKNDTKKLENRLKELGDIYYEKYYNLFSEDTRIDFFKRYSTSGITVDLENIARTVSETKDLPSEEEILKEFSKCKIRKTKITFYPIEPFSVKDYKMTIKLKCNK